MSQLQTEIQTLENRANELRDRRDKVARDSSALDARVALGDVDAVSDAASKRAELETINRAIDSMGRDLSEMRDRLASDAKQTVEADEIERVRGLKSEMAAAFARRREIAHEAAAALDVAALAMQTEMQTVWNCRAEINGLQTRDAALFGRAFSPSDMREMGYNTVSTFNRWSEPLLGLPNVDDVHSKPTPGKAGVLAAIQTASFASRKKAAPK